MTRGDWIEKRYLWPHLLDPREVVMDRCAQIVSASQRWEFLAETHIDVDEEGLTYRQRRIVARPWKDLSEREQRIVLTSWAGHLEELAATGFVHGDIHARNVVFDGVKMVLVDLEPSFRQLRFGRKVVLSAVPRVSSSDRARRQLTVESDKIGFYLTARKLIGRPAPSWNRSDSKAERLAAVLPCDEQRFLHLSFREILEHIYEAWT